MFFEKAVPGCKKFGNHCCDQLILFCFFFFLIIFLNRGRCQLGRTGIIPKGILYFLTRATVLTPEDRQRSLLSTVCSSFLIASFAFYINRLFLLASFHVNSLYLGDRECWTGFCRGLCFHRMQFSAITNKGLIRQEVTSVFFFFFLCVYACAQDQAASLFCGWINKYLTSRLLGLFLIVWSSLCQHVLTF